MDKTDRLRDYGLAFLLYEHGLGICGYELIRELFIVFIKLILNSYLQKQLLKKKLTITLKAEDLFDSSKLNDVKRVNFVVQNRTVDNFNRCIIASISYNFNSFKDKYKGSGSAEDEINRF